MYQPTEPATLENAEQVRSYLRDELRAIAREMSEFDAVDLRTTFAEPIRPRQGMIAYADGAGWNPGAGAGLYVFDGSGWVPLTGGGGGGGGPVPDSRTLTAGSGLTGGGDLSADRTFNVGAGSGILVAADTVAVDFTAVAAAGHVHTASQITDFSEATDDRVAALLTAGTNITLSYNDAAGTLTINASGGGVTDGNKTDITVSGGGATWTIDNDVVTYAKMQNVSATSRFIGRITGGAGDPEELTGTQATTLLDLFSTSTTTKGLVPGSNGVATTNFLRADGTWAIPSGSGAPLGAQYIVGATDATLTAERVGTSSTSILWDFGTAGQALLRRAALTGDVTASQDSNATTIANDAVTFAKMQNSAAAGLSVVGRNTNSAGDFAEIAAGTDGHVLRRSGTTLAFGTIATGGITDGAVTFAKQQNIATSRIVGRVTAGSGVQEELTGTQATTLLDVFTSSLKGLAPASGGGTANFLRADGTWAAPPGGGGAPTSASYVVIGLDGTLSAERVLTAGTGISLTDGGANGNATIAVNQAANFAWTGNHSFVGINVATPGVGVTTAFLGSIGSGRGVITIDYLGGGNNYHDSGNHVFRSADTLTTCATINTGGIQVPVATASTSHTSGALTVSGGAGIAGVLNVQTFAGVGMPAVSPFALSVARTVTGFAEVLSVVNQNAAIGDGPMIGFRWNTSGNQLGAYIGIVPLAALTADLFFATANGAGPIEQMRITAAGVVQLTQGQIKFPGTQVPSSDVNTLDDYEEGTWTPSLLFGGASTGITYSTQAASYTKIGNRVFIELVIQLTSKGTATGTATIATLPFALGGSVNALCTVGMANAAASAATAVLANISTGVPTSITLQKFSAGVQSLMTDADFNSNTLIRVSAQYPTA